MNKCITLLPTGYPFSKKVRIINGATKPSGPLMHFVNEHLISTSEDKNVAEHVNMFRRSNPNVVTPGSVLSVSFYNNPARTNTTAFTGVVLAIKRRGVDTSFVLRSVVARTGVEVRFNAASNMIQEIKVAARADLSKADQQVQGRLPRARRAKLYYLRDQPQRMPRLASKG